ncbi:MAG: hypothetical protein ISS72_10100 [Candidatus Brocadiae bacterium]|nr:hypothetical protein [Candidatus Brocadiia bacterium]
MDKPPAPRLLPRGCIKAVVRAVALTALCVGAVFVWRRWLDPGRHKAPFASCRNHASFVGLALDRYLLAHGEFPHEPGVPGEELVCRLDVQGASGNCNLGAPEHMIGGWQMVSASPAAWDEILATLKGPVIPVLWCGRPHPPGGPWKTTVRIVFAIGLSGQGYDTVDDLVARNAYADDRGKLRMSCFFDAIDYGMPEEELVERLEAVNAILRSRGEPETPLNIEGGKDYDAIGRPYQTDDSAPATPKAP